MKKTQLCNLQPPANCDYRIDGKMSFTILCGNNSLNESYKKCPYKQEAEIVFDSVQQANTAICARFGVSCPLDGVDGFTCRDGCSQYGSRKQQPRNKGN